MTTPPFRRRGLMENRRETLRRINNMTVKVQEVSGRVLIDGSGEVSVSVPFAVKFIERPVFTYGGEMDDNHRASAGSFPTISAVVLTWGKEGEVEGATEGYYVSAEVAVYTTGSADHKIWLHYSFKAKGIRNPVLDSGTTDETI